MLTSNIGKLFVDAYNKKYCTDYDGKSFFIEKYYPLFFNQNKYMMTAGNSPLENPKISWDKMIKGDSPFETQERRKERLENLLAKIDNNAADASIAIGFPVADILGTTSGQVTNMDIGISKEDMFLSWIGAGFGVGVLGGFSVLFDNPLILLDIFEGWSIYRNALNSISNLKGNQVTTWNGQWLAHKYSSDYSPDNPMANFDPFISNDGLQSIKMLTWTNILIAIATEFSNPRMMGYVYNIGKTNTTIGFIPFIMNQIRKPKELYLKIFGYESYQKAEPLWGTAFGFAKACQSGIIGIKAMEPKGLREYMEEGHLPKYGNDEDNQVKFKTYQIWLQAMLNNEELWSMAKDLATELQKYAQCGERGKVGNLRKAESVLASTNKKTFIEGLTGVISDASNKEALVKIAASVNSMVADNVPYFLTLVRFQYASINNNQ